MQSETLSLISPLGLAQRTQVFYANNPVPLIILLIVSIGIFALAYKLGSMRDLGQGFIAEKPGRAYAKKRLLSSGGLQSRLLRKSALIWLIVVFVTAASYGSIIGEIDQFVADSPAYLQIVGIPEEMLAVMSPEMQRDVIIDAFSSFINISMAVIALIPILIFAMKLRSEEKDGRTEQILARCMSKKRYFGGFLIETFTLSVALQFLTAQGLYLASSATSESGSTFVYDRLLHANMAILPAIWVIIGIAVFVVGVFPKATGVVWGFFGVVTFLTLMGNLPDIPDWLSAVSPFTHVPTIPVTVFGAAAATDYSLVPSAVMIIIAATLTTSGIIAYSKRDLC
jgi:ABC-2 type transport system permease protein